MGSYLSGAGPTKEPFGAGAPPPVMVRGPSRPAPCSISIEFSRPPPNICALRIRCCLIASAGSVGISTSTESFKGI
jgi:hypothetical protein